MRKIVSSALVAAAAAAIVGIGTSPASAADTWTLQPGGDFTATGTEPTTLTDTDTGAVLTCASSDGTGSAAGGTGLSGTGIAEVDSLNFDSCTGPLNITFTVGSSGFPWSFNATSYDSANGVASGELTGISAHLNGAFCSADVDGPGGAGSGTGTVTGHYDNNTGTLTIDGGTLTVYNVSGCFGQLNNGDQSTFNGSYLIDPSLTITSP